MKIGLRIMYNGTNYSGFQRQNNAETIQNRIEDVLSIIHLKEVKTIGSSRTDAGVHCLDNLVIFDTDKEYLPSSWRDILNNKLPQDIRVRLSYRCKDNFHPLQEKGMKTYKYVIYNEHVNNPMFADRSWHIGKKLNLSKIQDAAKVFIGEHNFKAFKNGNKDYLTEVRNIFESKIVCKDSIIEYHVSANGFMYNMVRLIVGTIVDVGLDKKNIEDILEAIKTGDKRFVGRTAPAKGLTLVKVDYEGKEVYG